MASFHYVVTLQTGARREVLTEGEDAALLSVAAPFRRRQAAKEQATAALAGTVDIDPLQTTVKVSAAFDGMTIEGLTGTVRRRTVRPDGQEIAIDYPRLAPKSRPAYLSDLDQMTRDSTDNAFAHLFLADFL